MISIKFQVFDDRGVNGTIESFVIIVGALACKIYVH